MRTDDKVLIFYHHFFFYHSIKIIGFYWKTLGFPIKMKKVSKCSLTNDKFME